MRKICRWRASQTKSFGINSFYPLIAIIIQDILYRVLQILFDRAGGTMRITKRDVYYMDTQLFNNQHVVDTVIDNLASIWQVKRDSLGVISSAKGQALGHLRVQFEDKIIDFCTNTTILQGPFEDWKILEAPKVVLIVEKEAVFQTIIQLYPTLIRRLPPILIVTGRGYPCMSTMQFVNWIAHMSPFTKMLALVDYDAYGLDIAFRYRLGSKLPADQSTTCCPRLELLGIQRTHLEFYSSGSQLSYDTSRHPISGRAEKKLSILSAKAKAIGWDQMVRVIKEMEDGNFTTEIESLYRHDTTVLIEYLVQEIQTFLL